MSLVEKASTSKIEGNTETQGSGNTNHGYVSWKGIKVKIPSKPFNAGGKDKNYTPEKVLNTLNFYYNMAIKDDLNEAFQEETIDSHAHHLLNEVLTYTLKRSQMTQEAYDWFVSCRKGIHRKKKVY